VHRKKLLAAQTHWGAEATWERKGEERIEGKGNGQGNGGEKRKWDMVDFYYFLFFNH